MELFIHGGVYSGVIYSGGVYSGGVYSELFIPGLFIPVTLKDSAIDNMYFLHGCFVGDTKQFTQW